MNAFGGDDKVLAFNAQTRIMEDFFVVSHLYQMWSPKSPVSVFENCELFYSVHKYPWLYHTLDIDASSANDIQISMQSED